MGVPMTEQTIRAFMSLFSGNQLKETISQESAAGNKVILGCESGAVWGWGEGVGGSELEPVDY